MGIEVVIFLQWIGVLVMKMKRQTKTERKVKGEPEATPTSIVCECTSPREVYLR